MVCVMIGLCQCLSDQRPAVTSVFEDFGEKKFFALKEVEA